MIIGTLCQISLERFAYALKRLSSRHSAIGRANKYVKFSLREIVLRESFHRLPAVDLGKICTEFTLYPWHTGCSFGCSKVFHREGGNMRIVKRVIAGSLLAGALTVPQISALADDHGKLHIPPGHLPPAGKCRIWYPGTPPGHQPPPGDCRVLSRQLPSGAYLVSRDRVWRYDERPYHYYQRPYPVYGRPDRREEDRYRGAYDPHGYSRRNEIKQDMKDVRAARNSVEGNRQQLEKNTDELKKDRAELRKDIRNGAGRQEIRQDRREIREDAQKISANKEQLRQSERKLDSARQELRDDLRKR